MEEIKKENNTMETASPIQASQKVMDTECENTLKMTEEKSFSFADKSSEGVTKDIIEDTKNHEKGRKEEKEMDRKEEKKVGCEEKKEATAGGNNDTKREENNETDYKKDSKENNETNHTINSKKDDKEDSETNPTIDSKKDHEKNKTTDSKQAGETGHEKNNETEETLPEIHLPDPTSGYENDISVFCISQRGESHIKNNLPCQDRSGFRWVNKQIVIASIADGVGSCQLSDYGAETAVKSSLDFLEKFLEVEMNQPDFVFDTPSRIKMGLSGAMQYAFDSVEKRAEELEVLSYSLQSTLTLAVYDGTTLYFAHAGDDGIVALDEDGIYAMVTARIKGEEASSVFPLQSKQWTYGKVNNTVGFVMATDGVLDAFVRPESENNRVYYRFMEPVFYTTQTDAESAKSNCNDWDEYLKTEAYRNAVTDDITFVGVVNQKAIQKSQKPVFDDEAWNKQTAEYEKKRRNALYPSQNKKSPNKKNPVDKKVEKKKESEPRRNSNDHETCKVSDPKSNPKQSSNYNANYNTNYNERRFSYNENREMIVNGLKQTFTGVVDISVGLKGAMTEVGGEIRSTMEILSEQTAERIRQSRMQKNQQKLNTDKLNTNKSNTNKKDRDSSTDTNQ